MSNRHLARTIAMQTLYECDFNKLTTAEEIAESLERNKNEFAPEFDDNGFIVNLICSIIVFKEKY